MKSTAQSTLCASAVKCEIFDQFGYGHGKYTHSDGGRVWTFIVCEPVHGVGVWQHMKIETKMKLWIGSTHSQQGTGKPANMWKCHYTAVATNVAVTGVAYYDILFYFLFFCLSVVCQWCRRHHWHSRMTAHQPLSARCQKHIISSHYFVFFLLFHISRLTMYWLCDLPTGIWWIFNVVSANFSFAVYFYFSYSILDSLVYYSQPALSPTNCATATLWMWLVLLCSTLMPRPFAVRIFISRFAVILYCVVWADTSHAEVPNIQKCGREGKSRIAYTHTHTKYIFRSFFESYNRCFSRIKICTNGRWAPHKLFWNYESEKIENCGTATFFSSVIFRWSQLTHSEHSHNQTQFIRFARDFNFDGLEWPCMDTNFRPECFESTHNSSSNNNKK